MKHMLTFCVFCLILSIGIAALWWYQYLPPDTTVGLVLLVAGNVILVCMRMWNLVRGDRRPTDINNMTAGCMWVIITGVVTWHLLSGVWTLPGIAVFCMGVLSLHAMCVGDEVYEHSW